MIEPLLYILQIDDAHDAADVNVLLDAVMAEGFDLCTTEIMPGVSHIACNLQMFTRIYRCRLMSPNNQQISNMFDSILRVSCYLYGLVKLIQFMSSPLDRIYHIFHQFLLSTK